jgi:hypothetical protein
MISTVLSYSIITLCFITIACTSLFMFYAGKQVGRIEAVGNKLAIYEARISEIPLMRNDIDQLKNMYNTTRTELTSIRETLDKHFNLNTH